MPGWLSRNDFVAGEPIHHSYLNNLANDMRNWGGNVNGGGFALTNAKTSVTAGTVALPSVASDADPDTGLYWPSANVLGVATAGAARMRIGVEALFTAANIQSMLRVKDTGSNNALLLENGAAGPGYIYRGLYWPFHSTALSFMRFHSDASGTSYPLTDLTIDTTGFVGINKPVPGSRFAVAGLTVFVDRAAAVTGGLTAGDGYVTAAGQLMIV